MRKQNSEYRNIVSYLAIIKYFFNLVGFFTLILPMFTKIFYRFFIVSPKDIVVASLYDTDDRIEWLLSHGKFEQALEAVTTNNGKDCKRHTVLDVGRIYLDHLLAYEKYDEAGKLCLKILGRNKKLWEEEVRILFSIIYILVMLQINCNFIYNNFHFMI